MTLVLDASALLELLLGTPRGRALLLDIDPERSQLHVPALCDVEIASGLVRLLVRRIIDTDRAAGVIEDLEDLPLLRHGHLALITRIVALRGNFSAYDAAYVALAETLGAILVTGDDRLARAVQAHTRVEVRKYP
ncbi:MAG: type II toxin-antitoxin system VapC family toxin [Thermoanaerobaculia bacterium]